MTRALGRRRWWGIAFVVGFIILWSARAPAEAAERTYRMSADSVAFYANRFILSGRGHVSLDLGDGATIDADAFSMDVRSNRFLVAGNVRLRVGALEATYLAFSADLVERHAYAIDASDEPQRLSFADNDFAHPLRGAQAPDGTFALPLIADPATKLGARITIGTRNYLRYGRCRTQIVGGVGIYLPVPDCYINVGDDPNLAQSALSGANLGGALKLTGNANAISAIFFNYDGTNGAYAALQQNLSSTAGWAVLALTASRYPGASLVAASTVDDAFGARFSAHAQALPASSAGGITAYRYADLRLAAALPFGYAEVFTSAGSASGTGDRSAASRPSSAQADVATPNVSLGGGTFASMRVGYGERHDPADVQRLGTTGDTTLGFGYANATLSAPAIPLGAGDAAHRFELGLLATETIQTYSIPHETAIATAGASIAKRSGATTLSLGYTIANVADRYAEPQLVYPAGGFDGRATFRTIALAATFEASPRLTGSLTVRGHVDVPAPAAGAFPVVDAAPLGQNPYPYQLGAPPADVTIAGRLRINPQLSIDVTDTKFINPRGWPGNAFQFLIRP